MSQPDERSAANVLLFPTSGMPTTGEATVRIGGGPPLTASQLRDVLVVGGVEYRRATMTASRLLQGTTGLPIIQRTAQDAYNEMEAAELREHRALLLGLVRKSLSPLRLRAVDELIGWHFASTLAERLDITRQHAGNICAYLHEIGLVERRDAPQHLRGRSPWLYRTVDAVHGPEREAELIESVKDAARRLRHAS